MKIKLRELEILDDDPFKNDALNRKVCAEALTTLLQSIDEPFVMSIDSPWGTGKTTFVKMLKKYLENSGFPCIYYNAWESDFSNDALVSLISEIEIGIRSLQLNTAENKIIKQQFDQVKKLGTKLAKYAIPAAIKIATYGLVDIDKVTQETISKFAEEIAKEEIKKYESSKKNLLIFRERLKDLVEEITKVEIYKNKPLVIFIDELDRCRPLFAIEILEKAKHFFNTEGIIFVLSTDKDQIAHSISSIYGAGMESGGYLRRIIDLNYTLPTPSKGEFTNYLFRKYDLTEFFNQRTHQELRYDSDHISVIFSELSTIFNLSLRDQTQCFTQLSIAMRMTRKDQYIDGIPLTFLIILKLVNKELYYNFIHRSVNTDTINKYLADKKNSSTLLNSNYGFALIAYLLWIENDKNSNTAGLNIYKENSNNTELSEEERYKANRIIEIYNSFSNRMYAGLLEVLVKKIELLIQFVNEV